jgi:hypothetical protein
MARIRTIKPEFFDDPGLGRLVPTARLLFIGLWTQCDRAGRLEDEPTRLKVRLAPYDDVNVDALLADLVAADLIYRYEACGKRVIQVVTFEKHQRPHPKEPPSLLPELTMKKNGKPGKETASREKDRTSRVDLGREGDLGSGNGEGERKGRGRADALPVADDFEAFWLAWPSGHRVNRKQAVEQWQKLTEADRALAIDTVGWRVGHDTAWQGPKADGQWAIPHPFRFLRDRRFTDARHDSVASSANPILDFNRRSLETVLATKGGAA